MNKQELIEKIKNLSYTLTWNTPRINREIVIDLIEQLDELQPLKLKDIISRMKQLFPNNRTEWIDEILKEFGEEFGSMKFKAGYEQGKFESGLAGIERAWNKPVVPQFVADWIEYFKNCKGTLYGSTNPFSYYGRAILEDFEGDYEEVLRWIRDNSDTYARAWLDGYEVEKEKRYLVKIIGVGKLYECLNFDATEKIWKFFDCNNTNQFRTHHTRKELEQAGFGDVFNSPLFEVEEVE